MAISILIADDHDIIREGIKNILRNNPDYKIVGEAVNGEEAVATAKKLKPDILLLDISMPKKSGLEAIQQVHYVSPKTKILVITVHKANTYIMKAFRAGAKGYLQKENAGEDLLFAISKIARGETYLSSTVSSYLVEKIANGKGEELSQESFLTPREEEVLRLVVAGKTAKQIADVLFISPRTVENYKNALLKKLNLSRTSDLIKYAIKHKLVDIDEY